MKTISIVNQKGGVGKTTTTFNLAYELTKQGKRCLVIDLDPQANLTILSNLNPIKIDKLYSINQLLQDSMSLMDTDDLGRPIKDEADVLNKVQNLHKTTHGYDILPTNIDLAKIAVQIDSCTARELILKRGIEVIRKTDKYDIILIDCPPTLGLLMMNALGCSDEVLIPTEMEYHSARGIEEVFKSIYKIKNCINDKVKIGGLILTKYRKDTKLTNEVEKMLKETYEKYIPIFKNTIPNTIAVGKATLSNYPLSVYIEKNKYDEAGAKAQQAYQGLAQEIITKLM